MNGLPGALFRLAIIEPRGPENLRITVPSLKRTNERKSKSRMNYAQRKLCIKQPIDAKGTHRFPYQIIPGLRLDREQ